MVRVTNAPAARRRHKKFLKMAKGYRGARSTTYRIAKETVIRGLVYAFRDRKVRKRDFRSLWIVRISAAARLNGLSYSRFMNGLKRAEVNLNRKILADIAIKDETAFAELAKVARDAV